MRNKKIDIWLCTLVLILLGLGIIMVFSASAPYSYIHNDGDTYYFLRKQFIWALIGVACMFITSFLDYRKLGKISFPLVIFSIGLLVVILIPGVGTTRNEATRWITILGQSFQPSEFAKLAIIMFFSYSLSRKNNSLDKFISGFIPYIFIIGIYVALLMMEPHFSGTILITSVAVIILFAAGARIAHFLIIGLPAIGGAVFLVLSEEYRLKRVVSFLHPWEDAQGANWQIVNSLYAIGSGGLFGRGLGRSLQKYLYIPEPHNDFIFSVMAEEIGFIGVLCVMLLFLLLIFRGIRIAINAEDKFGSLLATGITSLIAVQFITNVAIVTGSMPVTGMPLPFFSAGGSSLLFLLINVGILLSVSRYSSIEKP